ncbi:MAG: ABC transporter ATP-binding protein [Candidatus Altiarchaeales archaeon WOR_SM1_79]|nr:MAG: ABC transporter ATP-binding protein [Candidatus Altiarchaeales archaeon WOR_SM1_79]
MKLILETNNENEYLSSSKIIDYDSKNIQEIASHLSKDITDEVQLAKIVYEYVRDNIAHSSDINSSRVTYKASDVLKYREGMCHAKSHLLAAILRYLKIPTGFCYQKLILDDTTNPELRLHGLNAIYLKTLKRWIRVDARGNKKGVNAEFSIEKEKLAYPVREELGERDGYMIYAKPSKNVVNALKNSKTLEELIENLPSEIQGNRPY